MRGTLIICINKFQKLITRQGVFIEWQFMTFINCTRWTVKGLRHNIIIFQKCSKNFIWRITIDMMPLSNWWFDSGIYLRWIDQRSTIHVMHICPLRGSPELIFPKIWEEKILVETLLEWHSFEMETIFFFCWQFWNTNDIW